MPKYKCKTCGFEQEVAEGAEVPQHCGAPMEAAPAAEAAETPAAPAEQPSA